MRRKGIALILFLAVALSFGGAGCTLQQDPRGPAGRPVTLTYWGVFDDSDAIAPLIQAYRATHPNVTINYRKLRYEEYERELLEALAEDRGPDIFAIHNTWVDKYIGKIQPLPPKVSVSFLEEQGTLKKEVVSVWRDIPTKNDYSPDRIRERFVTTVAEDVIRSDSRGVPAVMGLPRSIDTMALFYNQELFDRTGLTEAPKTWDALLTASQALKIVDLDSREVRRAGIAMGGASNVDRAPDILTTMMMQYGVPMNSGGSVSFASQIATQTGERIPLAAQVLSRYTDYAAQNKDTYTWSETMPSSFDAFVQGKAAMFFGYAYHNDLLKRVAPHIRYRAVPMPQVFPERPITPANYWIDSVSRKTKNSDYAWDFLMFASHERNVGTYLKSTGKPTALRSLITEQLQNDDMRPFAAQVLMARSWYRGRNPIVAEEAFRSMITNALTVKGDEKDELPQLIPMVGRAQSIIQSSY